LQQLKIAKVIQQFISKSFKISILLILISASLFAQTGKIAGKVTDKVSGETLIGLTVGIDGTTKGAATDVEGRFVIANLAPGKYNVTFRYLGYQTKNVTGVEVKDGAVTTLNIILEETTSQSLGEVVVTATYRQATVGALYAEQKNAVSISSGISSDQIKKSPDRNTSEIVKRVSGASIQDNKFIVVRGLNERYNLTMLNNSVLPSSESDRKAFSFDIFPSNMIDKIVITKTATADLPGDFAGGVVQIATKDVPDADFLEFSIGTGFNTVSTGKDFISNGQTTANWLSFTDNSRKLPNSIPSPLGIRQSTDAQKVGYSLDLGNPYRPQTSTALPSQNHQLTLGLRKDLKEGGNFGTIVSLNYRNSMTLVDFTRTDFDDPTTLTNPLKSFNDPQNRFNSTLGGLANFALTKEKFKISLKNIFSRGYDETYYQRTGFDGNNIIDVQLFANDLNTRSLSSTQLDGDHQIGKKGYKFNWNLNYSRIDREQPDFRTAFYTRSQNTNEPYSLVDRNTRRFYSDLEEDNYGGSMNLTIPFDWKSNKQTFKVGALAALKSRDFNGRFFQLRANNNAFTREISKLPIWDIYNPLYIKEDVLFFDDFTNNVDSYKANSELGAAYAMMDNKFGEKVRLVYGIRTEYYQQNIDATDQSGRKVDGKQNFLDVLPSANLTYNLSDKANFRVSASRTVNRPEFRELAPFDFFNFTENNSVVGNPGLKRGQINNVDLRYELYPSQGEAVTATLFYKDFSNPIEFSTDGQSNQDLRKFTYRNAESAYALGFELDIRKKLSFLGSAEWLNNFIAFTNVSFIKSQVNVVTLIGTEKRPLQGQSPFLVNAGLQYNSTKSGFSTSLLYNRIGDRIYVVGIDQGYPAWIDKGRDILDIQVSKRILKNKAEIKLNFSDLLAQDFLIYQNFTDYKLRFDEKDSRSIFRSNQGSNIGLSFSYNIGL
jgi:outer membrane receptor protein involved in Fe transport